MLYFEDKARDQWPAVARILSSVEPLDMVLCLYPGEDFSHLPDRFQPSRVKEVLERVTTYDDTVDTPPCTQRLHVDEELLTWLESHTFEFEEWGDSLSAYPPGAWDLAAAAIPHEGVILVADRFGSALDAAGIRFSPDPPDWW